MSDFLEKRYLDCDCEDSSCVIRFTWEKEQVNFHDSEGNPIFFEVQLQSKTYQPWYKRVWEGLRYIFSRRYAIRWTEVLLDKNRVTELRDICNEALKGDIKTLF